MFVTKMIGMLTMKEFQNKILETATLIQEEGNKQYENNFLFRKEIGDK